METVTVYRYEHADGLGPYRPRLDSNFADRLSAAHSDSFHPVAWSLVPDEWRNASWFCACSSRDSLATWFDGFERDLRDHGYKVVAYTLPREHAKFDYTSGQVVFLKKKATLREVVA